MPQQPTTTEDKSSHVNTLLITILLAISGWILIEVIDHGKVLAKFTERVDMLTVRVEDVEKHLRSRP